MIDTEEICRYVIFYVLFLIYKKRMMLLFFTFLQLRYALDAI